MMVSVVSVHAPKILVHRRIFPTFPQAEASASNCAIFIAQACTRRFGVCQIDTEGNWRETVAQLRSALADVHADYRFDLDVEVIATLKDLSDGVDGYELEHAIHGALIYDPTYFQHGPINANEIVAWWRSVRVELRNLVEDRPANPVQ